MVNVTIAIQVPLTVTFEHIAREDTERLTTGRSIYMLTEGRN